MFRSSCFLLLVLVRLIRTRTVWGIGGIAVIAPPILDDVVGGSYTGIQITA